MSTVISAGVSEDLAKKVDELREEGESRSAAIKRLLRTGIEYEGANGVFVTRPALLLLIGFWLATAAFVETNASTGYVGFGLITVSLLYAIADRSGLLDRLKASIAREVNPTEERK